MIVSVGSSSALETPGAPMGTNLMGKGSSRRTLSLAYGLSIGEQTQKSHLLACGMQDLVIDPAVMFPIPCQRRVRYEQIV